MVLSGASLAMLLVLIAGVAPRIRYTARGEEALRQVAALRRELTDPATAQRFGPEEALPYAAAFGQAHVLETRRRWRWRRELVGGVRTRPRDGTKRTPSG